MEADVDAGVVEEEGGVVVVEVVELRVEGGPDPEVEDQWKMNRVQGGDAQGAEVGELQEVVQEEVPGEEEEVYEAGQGPGLLEGTWTPRGSMTGSKIKGGQLPSVSPQVDLVRRNDLSLNIILT